jgi:centriolar protein POC1
MTVRLWENSSLGNFNKIRAHSGAVRCVSFSNDGRLLLTTSNDKTIKVWKVIDRKF